MPRKKSRPGTEPGLPAGVQGLPPAVLQDGFQCCDVVLEGGAPRFRRGCGGARFAPGKLLAQVHVSRLFQPAQVSPQVSPLEAFDPFRNPEPPPSIARRQQVETAANHACGNLARIETIASLHLRHGSGILSDTVFNGSDQAIVWRRLIAMLTIYGNRPPDVRRHVAAKLHPDRGAGNGRVDHAPVAAGGKAVRPGPFRQGHHHDLHAGRPPAPGHVRNQARRPLRDPRRVSGHQDQRAGRARLRAPASPGQDHGQAGAGQDRGRSREFPLLLPVHDRAHQRPPGQSSSGRLAGAGVGALQAEGSDRCGHSALRQPVPQVPPRRIQLRPTQLPGRGPHSLQAAGGHQKRHDPERDQPGTAFGPPAAAAELRPLPARRGPHRLDGGSGQLPGAGLRRPDLQPAAEGTGCGAGEFPSFATATAGVPPGWNETRLPCTWTSS